MVVTTVLCDAGYGVEELYLRTKVGGNIVETLEASITQDFRDAGSEGSYKEFKKTWYKEVLDAVEVTIIEGSRTQHKSLTSYELSNRGFTNPTEEDWLRELFTK